VPGTGGTFSLEEGSGQHFVVHLRLWTDAEAQALKAQSSTTTNATTNATTKA
jgi:dihydroneopterin aldolase